MSVLQVKPDGPTLKDQYWWVVLPVILRSWTGKTFTFVLLRKGDWILIATIAGGRHK